MTSTSRTHLLAALGIVALSFCAFLWLEYHYRIVLGAEPVQQASTWYIPIFITFATHLGVLARSVYEVLTMADPPTTYPSILIEALAPAKTLLALVASPILMALFYEAIRS